MKVADCMKKINEIEEVEKSIRARNPKTLSKDVRMEITYDEYLILMCSLSEYKNHLYQLDVKLNKED